ncbi:5'-AMP-activated protein kinase subunit gamma-1 [Bulinus truncatus]|nr:5'-AMP-activated protein kinase subunit gamma-1 [Bulinus truncatus]
MFVEHRISALPVVDSSGQVTNIYAKFDVINLAADKSYNNLDIPLSEALKNRHHDENEVVATCQLQESLASVMEKIVKAEVHRLVVCDESGGVKGIASLSDLLKYIVLRPMAEEFSKIPVNSLETDSMDYTTIPSTGFCTSFGYAMNFVCFLFTSSGYLCPLEFIFMFLAEVDIRLKVICLHSSTLTVSTLCTAKYSFIELDGDLKVFNIFYVLFCVQITQSLREYVWSKWLDCRI